MQTWFLLIVLRIIYHRSFIFHLLIFLNEDMTYVDMELISSKLKVRRITFEKKVSPHYLENVYHRALIFRMLNGLDKERPILIKSLLC